METVLIISAIVSLIAGLAALTELLWKPFRRFVLRRKSEIERLEEKVDRLAEYFDGLATASSPTLRAAYEEARRLQLEGYQAQSADKHREAIDRFTRALPLAENESQRAALHVLRGNSYWSISDYDHAASDYEDTLQLSQHISPDEDGARAYAAALGNLGVVHARRGDLDRAEQHHKKALQIHRETGNRLGQASQLGNLGNVYLWKGDLRKAEQHHKKALDIDHEDGNRRGEAEDLTNLGIIYGQRGNLEGAEQYCNKALKIDRQIGNRLGEAQDLGNLGNVYYQRDDLKRAEKCYRQALEVHRAIGYRLGEAGDLANLGLLAEDRGHLRQAQQFLRDALTIFKDIGASSENVEKACRILARIEEQKRQQPQPPTEQQGDDP